MKLGARRRLLVAVEQTGKSWLRSSMFSASTRCLQRHRSLPHHVHRRPARRNLFQTREFTVLAFESSADDTCVAVVNSERKILSNVVIRQLDQHEQYGGIHPFVAIQAHQRNMPTAVRRALDEANLDLSKIDGIAFTRGPGIGGCLSVCSNAAKNLAAALNKPLVGVHHMQAHALTPLLTSPPLSAPTFPFLTLLVSGGHTLLLLASSIRRFKILATTRDEAVGRTIDKVARDLHLKWDGRAPGAALEAFCRDGLASSGEKSDDLPAIGSFKIPLKGELAFSFSGLHSSVDRYISMHGVTGPAPNDSSKLTLILPDAHRLAIARAFQRAALAQLEEKVVLALRWCAEHRNSILAEQGSLHNGSQIPVKHIVVSGGVASNSFLRDRLATCLKENFPSEDLSLVFPPPALCTDNAAMIAWASMHRFLAGEFDDYSIESHVKWPIEELDRHP